MTHKPPGFWYAANGEKSPASTALLPFSGLYALGGTARRACMRTRRAPVPVVCVGNLVAGGGGKTPAAIMLANLLCRTGLSRAPWFLTRGYGGTIRQTAIPYPGETHYTAQETGDEPLLLNRHGPVVIDPDRYRGALRACAHGADLIIMDDGMQNPGLHKDITVLLIDGERGFGNGRLIPAGPLRETLARGLQRADMFIMTGDDKTGAARRLPPEKPLFRGRIAPCAGHGIEKGTKCAAFAGIANPDKFRRTLESLGADIGAWHTFPDHHPYSEETLAKLCAEAQSLGAALITTEKDYVRLAHLPGADRVRALPVALDMDEEERLARILEQKIRTDLPKKFRRCHAERSEGSLSC